jgi:hypothetical protein
LFGQFAVEQQIAGLEVVRVRCQLFDRIAPVQEDALGAVDKGDFRFAGRRGNEARVVGEIAPAGQSADVDDLGPSDPEYTGRSMAPSTPSMVRVAFISLMDSHAKAGCGEANYREWYPIVN